MNKLVIFVVTMLLLFSLIKSTTAQETTIEDQQKVVDCIVKIKYNNKILEKDKHNAFLQCLKK